MIKNFPDDLQQAIKKSLQEKPGNSISLIDFKTIAGGCINSGGRLSTDHGDYFLKWNDSKRFPNMFEKEALGLALLKKSDTMKIPSVIAVGETKQNQFLILDFIESSRPTKSYWRELGRGLANLHKKISPTFGLDHDNYIGSLPQSNLQVDNWIDFFIQSRIHPQLKLAVDAGALEVNQVKKFERLFNKLPSLFPIEKPALLHGDLWSGNVLVDHHGDAVLIDPAVYFGHREMELAYTRLFGGFESNFYGSYFEESPVAPGFNNRVDIYNLYPLLVHVNLFGGGYANQVAAILNRFA